MRKYKTPYSKVRDSRFKNGLRCKSNRTPSKTNGIDKTDSCKKSENSRLATSSRGYKTHTNIVFEQYRRWNRINNTSSSIY